MLTLQRVSYKLLSTLLSLLIVFQPLMPIYGCEIDSQPPGPLPLGLLKNIDEVKKFLPEIMKYRSIKAPLTFQGSPENTAAGILHFAEKDGRIFILFGKRDDELNLWCNLGGGSEAPGGPSLEANALLSAVKSTPQPLSSTLDQDAARESAQESNGIYAPHARYLKKLPFVDTYDPEKNMYYRLYFQKVQHVDEEVFNKKLQQAQHAHNKEYLCFKWFAATDVVSAVENEDSPLRSELYLPLLNTLSTDTARHFLKQLASPQKRLMPFQNFSNSLKIRPGNRLYIVGRNVEGLPHMTLSKSWPLVSVLEGPNVLELVKKKYKDNSCPGFERNRWETVEISGAFANDQLDEAVSALGASNVMIKKKFYVPEPLPVMQTPYWDPHAPQTLTRTHLAIVLGPAYKHPEEFKDDPNPTRRADLANIRLYFDIYQKMETDDNKREFKRQLTPLESDYHRFADALAWEEMHKHCPTIVHGTNSDAHSLLSAFTYNGQLFHLNFFGGSWFLRGTDIYFKKGWSLRDYIQHHGNHESTLSRPIMMYFNFAAFVGLQTSVTTSSSAEYVVNDHSVNEIDTQIRYEEALSLAGLMNANFQPFRSVFEQFLAYKHPKHGNSALITVSQNPEDLDQYNYPTSGGGDYYLQAEEQGYQGIPSARKIFHKIQTESKRLRALPASESFEVDTKRKRGLFPENILLLDPARMRDLTKVRVNGFSRFPLNTQEETLHDLEMRRVALCVGADWLSQRTQVVEDAFFQFPALKRLHRYVYEGITGKKLEEIPCDNGILQLIKSGTVDGLKHYQTFTQNCFKGLTSEKLIEAAKVNHDPRMLAFIVQDVLKNPLEHYISQKDFYALVRSNIVAHNAYRLEELLYLWDPSKIPDFVKLMWVSLASELDAVGSILDYVRQKSPSLMNKAIDVLFEKDCGKPEELADVLEKCGVSPQDIIFKFYNRALDDVVDQYRHYRAETVLSYLVSKDRIDMTEVLTQTGDPILFLVLSNLKWTFYQPNIKEIMKKYPNKYAALRNRQGLTLLQAVQKQILETTHPTHFLWDLRELVESAGEKFTDVSYLPFLQFYGPCSYFHALPRSITHAPESIGWVHALQGATPQQLPTVIGTCPVPELLSNFENKIYSISNEVEIHRQVNEKRDQLTQERQDWLVTVKKLTPDRAQLRQHLLDSSYFHLAYYLGYFLKDEYSDVLPIMLARLYPNPKDFATERGCFYSEDNGPFAYLEYNPLVHLIGQHVKPQPTIDSIVKHIGISGICDVLLSVSYKYVNNMISVLSEHDVACLYQSLDQYKFGPEHRQHFLEMTATPSFPQKMKETYFKAHIEDLKISCPSIAAPIFWLMFMDEEHYSLISDLVKVNPALLSLETPEGLSFPTAVSSMLTSYKVKSILQFYGRLTGQDTALIPEPTSPYPVVYSFDEFLAGLTESYIHLFSDIDEVAICGQPWNYSAVRARLPLYTSQQLAALEYDSKLLDPQAPARFKQILTQKSRVSFLTARPAEASKFNSTFERLSSAGFMPDGVSMLSFDPAEFPYYDRGTFYCGEEDKGKIVFKVIDKLYGSTPTAELPIFYFPDDLDDNLKKIDLALRDTRYKYRLFHFRAIDKVLEPFRKNPALVLEAYETIKKTKDASLPAPQP